MSDQIQDWTKRTQRYWYVDGLAEIGAGLTILMVGLCYLIFTFLHPSSLKNLILGLGLPVFIIGLAVFVRRIVRLLKEKITFPRTGYVSYRRVEPRRKINSILVAILTASVLGLIIYLSRTWVKLQWLTSISGLFAALLILLIAYRIRLIRFFILAIYTCSVGLLASLVTVLGPFSNEFFLICLGLGWIVSGSVTLARYLHSTMPANAEVDSENQ